MKANLQIREALNRNHVAQWELADAFHVSEPTMTRWLRHELLPAEKERFLDVISEIAEGKNGGD